MVEKKSFKNLDKAPYIAIALAVGVGLAGSVAMDRYRGYMDGVNIYKDSPCASGLDVEIKRSSEELIEYIQISELDENRNFQAVQGGNYHSAEDNKIDRVKSYNVKPNGELEEYMSLGKLEEVLNCVESQK